MTALASIKLAERMISNAKDLDAAEKNGMRGALVDRLRLSGARVEEMARGVLAVASQEDPIGKVVEGSVRPNGLQLQKIRVPLGVVLSILIALSLSAVAKKLLEKRGDSSRRKRSLSLQQRACRDYA